MRIPWHWVILDLGLQCADILQLEMANAHCVAANRSQQPNGHEAMGSPAGIPGPEPSYAHHHPSLPLHELQLQCIRQYTQDHDGNLHLLLTMLDSYCLDRTVSALGIQTHSIFCLSEIRYRLC